MGRGVMLVSVKMLTIVPFLQNATWGKLIRFSEAKILYKIFQEHLKKRSVVSSFVLQFQKFLPGLQTISVVCIRENGHTFLRIPF